MSTRRQYTILEDGMLRIDEVVDHKYKVVRLLGEGGMGSVWLAVDLRHNRLPIALKLLDSHKIFDSKTRVSPQQALDDDYKFRKLFLREAGVMRQLTGHSNIVSVIDADSCPKAGDNARILFYIAMEYIEGDNAESLVGTGDFKDVLRVALGAAKGIAVAHSLNIIHRDIKPSNILVGKNGAVKVSDFGIAKILGQTTADFTVPFFGTRAYMAPEQLQAHPHSNAHTDVYQFGATLYHLLTGLYANPHGLLSDFFSESQLSSQTPSIILPSIPESISNLVMRMLSKDPEVRPDFEEIKTQLQRQSNEHSDS